MDITTQPPPPPPPPPHVIIVSTPDMGHLIPITEFAKRLLLKFTFILAIHTSSPPTPGHRGFLSSLPSGIHGVFLPAADLSDAPSDARIVTLSSLTLARSLPPLRHLITDIISSGSYIVALVANLFSTDALDVASEFSLRRYVFFPSTAMCLSLLLHLEELDKTVSCEYADLVEPVNLPGCVPIQGRDLFSSVQDRKNDAYKWLLHHAKRYSLAEGIIVNTFEALEVSPITELLRPEPGKPSIYPVGPLIRTGSEEGHDWSEVSKWLDEQPRGSVLFVCFGSYWAHSFEQQTELALGLEKSDQRFLWVVRSPKESSVNNFKVESQGDPLWSLPEGFLERTKEKGLVVPKWAPQVGVLGHGSTGGFLSHCGWNSTLESVVHGVPLIAWPLYAEQKMNAAVLTDGLKVGLRPEDGPGGVVGRDEIARVVKKLMEGEEGKRMRIRMRELKNAAFDSLSKDGSSSRGDCPKMEFQVMLTCMLIFIIFDLLGLFAFYNKYFHVDRS